MPRSLAPGLRTTALLLARALGGPVTVVAFDGDGRQVVPERVESGAEGVQLSQAERAELAAGRRTALALGSERHGVLAVQDEDELLWVVLRPPDAALTLPRFAQHLAHAVRNSLSSIKLAVQTVGRSERLGPREQKRVQIAEREIARMERVVSTASEMARMPARAHEPLALHALLEAAVAATRPELEAREVVLEQQLEPGSDELVGDPRRVQLALENLLVLGARAMAAGDRLEVTLRRRQGGWELAVRDHGPPVPASERATLFEPLASGTRAAGLDLALVAQVARELGGEVLAEEASPGLRIVLRLPHREEVARGHAAAGR